jgi:hypothetical protein
MNQPKGIIRHVLLGLAVLTLAGTCLAQEQPGPQTEAPPAVKPAAPAQTGTVKVSSRADKIVVPSGTRLPLILHNGITTRNAKPGDPVYLETLFPITQENRIVIPAGSYVQGEILEAKRAGRVKGRGEIRVRLNRMILPNGYTVDLNAVPTNTGGGGNESVDNEGKVKGDSDKTSDVGTVIGTTLAGAGIGGAIGSAAGNGGKGLGIGAGVGAAAGLATVLLTRGPELELPRGTTVDVVLNRALYLDSDKVQFTDPGHATALPGANSREPVRTRRAVPY